MFQSSQGWHDSARAADKGQPMTVASLALRQGVPGVRRVSSATGAPNHPSWPLSLKRLQAFTYASYNLHTEIGLFQIPEVGSSGVLVNA